MRNRLSDVDLRRKAWDVLAERLGPVEALRFLSLTRTQPRDYQAWREAHFQGQGAADLLKRIQAATLRPSADRDDHV